MSCKHNYTLVQGTVVGSFPPKKMVHCELCKSTKIVKVEDYLWI